MQRSFWQGNGEYAVSLKRFFQLNCAAVLVSNLLRERKSETNSAFLPLADKWEKHRFADRLGDARTIVGNRDANVFLIFLEVEGDERDILSATCGLAGVQ